MISAIVPMRNEEENAEECLKTLKRALQESGQEWEIVVVDDASRDSTPQILQTLDFIKVVRIEEEERTPNVVGKSYALWRGYTESRGDVLLFLDADVRLSPFSLRRVLRRFKNVDMLSVSPRQIYGSPWEAALQPMVFKLLGKLYPLDKVSDSSSPIAAANGQFILIKRHVYEEVGTHMALFHEILEDVRLAERVKAKGYRLLFLHGGKFGIEARMYRSLDTMLAGWAKNLMLLLKGKVRLGVWFALTNLFESLTVWVLSLSFVGYGDYGMAMGVFLLGNLYFAYRFKTHHPFYSVVHATVGSSLMLYLLWLSYDWHRKGRVVWRGRTYHLYNVALEDKRDNPPT
ncbi:MAG: glycosyltransferase family 2 protein [Thermotogae bacterium]|nr:glycosyltransferase family 2 protein [Thermotogota bacterium]